MTKKEKVNVITIGLIFLVYLLYNYFSIILITIGLITIAVAFIYKFVDFETKSQELIARFHSDSKRNRPSPNLHIKKSKINQAKTIGDIGELEINNKLENYNKEFLLI